MLSSLKYSGETTLISAEGSCPGMFAGVPVMMPDVHVRGE